jgi:hypothetical protein
MKLRTRSSTPPTCAWRTIAAGSAFSAATSKLPDRRISRQIASTSRSRALQRRRTGRARHASPRPKTRRTDALIRIWRDAK